MGRSNRKRCPSNAQWGAAIQMWRVKRQMRRSGRHCCALVSAGLGRLSFREAEALDVGLKFGVIFPLLHNAGQFDGSILEHGGYFERNRLELSIGPLDFFLLGVGLRGPFCQCGLEIFAHFLSKLSTKL